MSQLFASGGQSIGASASILPVKITYFKFHKMILLCKEIQPVHPKGGQSWVFIGSTDVEAETPVLWPPDVKS